MGIRHSALCLLLFALLPAVTLADEAQPPPAAEKIPLPEPRILPRRSDYSKKRKEYRMPEFDASWKLSKEIYEKAVLTYDYWARDLEVNRFVTVVDLGKKSSERRFYVFDLEAGRVDELLTTHGKGSDPRNSGVGNDFSNEADSLKSSLGTYLTQKSYTGSHGYSLKLAGIEDTNSNAFERAIVIHSAPYVSELSSEAGRSWGCLVLDPIISRATIDRIKGGSLIIVGSSAPLAPAKKPEEKKKDEKPKAPLVEPPVTFPEDEAAPLPAPAH